MMGKRKAPSSSSTPPGQKAKGPRQDSGAADGSLPERRSFVHGSAFLIVCFACFLLGFRLSWEGKAAFLGAYRIGPESGKLVLRDTGTSLDYADSESGGGAAQGGLDLRPGAWESGQGDKYGAGVADGEWERIETRILASAGGVVNASESNRSRRLLPRPPPSPPEHPWVGRHNISVRPWPHPDAGETLLAHALIAAVQREQQNQFGVPLDRRKRMIVVTPTYRRAFQQIHLSHLTDTLRLAPEPLSWLVVEAGGPTEETQAILSKTGLADIHLLPVPGVTMPDVRAPERPIVEDYLRDVALGYIQKQAMEGVVVFADDSATLRLALFQELQKVRWFAAFSVGMLVQGGGSQVDLPVQGPVCGPEGDVRGWHAADHELLRLKKPAVVPKRALLGAAEKRLPGGEGAQRRLLALEVPERTEGFGAGSDSISQLGAGTVVRQLQQVEQSEYFEPELFIPKLEWVGFAFNARLLWAPAERPAWLREWKPSTTLGKVDAVVGDYEGDEDPTDLLARMVEDESQVETLGRCGKDVLAWWLKVEAAEEGQYPAGWRLAENLPVVAEPQEWSEEQWAEYEARLVEEKKKKKKKKSKKKKKAPEATKVEEDAAARQAAEQAAADEARRVEEEKQRELEQEAARQAEEERQTRLAEAQKAEVEDNLDSVQKAKAEVRTDPEKEGEKAESKLESSALAEKEALTNNAKEVLNKLVEGADGGVADDTQAREKQTS